MSEYRANFSSSPLQVTNVMFRTYTGEQLKPEGVLDVTVEHNGQQQRQLKLYVVNKGGPPLFGREWLDKIRVDWQTVKFMEAAPTNANTKSKLQQLLQKYQDVFAPGLGKLENIEAKLTLIDDATPKFVKARQLPYAMRPKVEAELDKLEKEGILSKVDHSEWATPIVPVVKRDNTVRICGDFKATLNPVLKVDQYPLPRIEDIFASLAGGQTFSKIDLTQAYLQMAVADDCRKYLTINTHRGLYRYNRLVFGVASAPAVWQRAIDQVLQGIPNVQCILDDMILTGKNDLEHDEETFPVYPCPKPRDTALRRPFGSIVVQAHNYLSIIHGRLHAWARGALDVNPVAIMQ